MKRKMLLLSLSFSVMFSVNTSAQIIQNDSINFSQQQFARKINHYLQRSKEQKKLAWILLGGGMALNFLGTIINDNSASGTGIISEAGVIATTTSIPLFFSASNNKNRAQLAYFEKNVAMATSDSLKKVYIEDAANYFSNKAKINIITAVVLSAVGGVFIVAAIDANSNDNSNNFLSGSLGVVLYAVAGIAVVISSIPFYVKGAHLQKTARLILRTQRIPKPELSSSLFSAGGGPFVALGIKIPL